VLEFDAPTGRRPPRLALSVDVDASGLIAAVRVIASSKKLAHLTGNSGAFMELQAMAAPAR
jgi:hypothetical protein